MAAKHDHTGRTKDRGDHGTYVRRPFMERPAWRALSPKAQMLYIWLRLEWKGPDFSNNGKIRLSCRQAAERIGIGVNAAAGAFHELQAKGFIVVTVLGALGVEGEARGPAYELTELNLQHSERKVGRKLYRDWAPGRDFPIIRHNVNNPGGKNGQSKSPSSKQGRSCHRNSDVSPIPVIKTGSPHHQNSDVPADFEPFPIIETETSLIAIPKGQARG
ncbi:hypothetical protein [Maricaulis sp.]|uniref:hypothetical protein n=1 Tax=Maricaulis sp. TaxID=1486257 RepID=UPI003A93911F